MKKVILFSTICILASAQCGGGKSYASNPVMPLWAIPSPFISTAATPDDGDVTKPSTNNDDDDIISYKIGDEDLSGNGAELTWDKAHGIFTVIGHGDLSKIKYTKNDKEILFYNGLKDFLSTSSGITYNKVVFSTNAELIADNVEHKKYATINNDVVRALLNNKTITELDLQDVAIESINGPMNNDWSLNPNGTFVLDGNSYNKNSTITKLYTPRVLKEDFELPAYTFHHMVGLKELFLGEGIVTLGEECLKHEGSALSLTAITFPNTLKKVKKNALNGAAKIMTFVFPEALEDIEEHAFTGTRPKDVYFLGRKAPKVAKYAWDDASYLSNNAFSPIVEDGEKGHAVTVDVEDKGFACRGNYIAGSGYETMLHYPSACTKEEAAKYTDITRNYMRLEQNMTADTDKGISITDQQIQYSPAKEENTLKHAVVNSCPKVFFYYKNNKNYGEGVYQAGYYDMYTHDQYLWPCINMMQRATVTGANGVLWDGVTTIGEGIRNAAKDGGNAESSYNGTGEEYIGLHQFVIAKNDVSATRTDEFDLSKYVDGKWHTICLSFDMTKYDMKQVFGKSKDENDKEVYNIRLCKFNEVVRVYEKGEQYIHLKFNDEKFASANDAEVVLEAHQSYMIKAKKEQAVDGGKLTKAVMRNYVAKPGNPEPTEVYSHDGTEAQAQADYPYRFIGTYLPQIYMPQYSYFFSKKYGTFRFQTGQKGKWNTNTSIIEAPEGERDYKELFTDMDEKANAKTFTSLNDWSNYSETTGIGGIVIESGDEVISTTGKVYNLSGQLVSRHGIEGLPKGIYIIGGKKLSVK